jgi:protein tyrosine/serine phosphatase
MMRLAAVLLLVAVLLTSAACHADDWQAAPPRDVVLPAGAAATAAYATLRTSRGPTRFQQVSPSVYRGGQPTRAQLELLRDLGVRTLIDLRQEPDAVAAEARDAQALGMTFRSFGFSGLGTPDATLLHAIVAAMSDARDGAVYVHCQQGRDRTSLVVALYRVWHDGWTRDIAWRREAHDYGHDGWRHFFFRKLDRAFSALTR